MILRQHTHLLNCDCIELRQPFRLRKTVIDKHCIQVLQIGKTHKLRHICVIADVALQPRILISPLLCSLAEQCIFSTSASLAYTSDICHADSSGGIRFSLIASVWIR